MKVFLVLLLSLFVMACCQAIPGDTSALVKDVVPAVVEDESEIPGLLLFLPDSMDSISGWLLYQGLLLLLEYPWLIWPLVFLALCVPVLSTLANYTGNAKFNKAGIFISSFLQLITFGSSKNQPDVLSMVELTTHRPSLWPDLLRRKITAHQKKLEKELESVPLIAPDTKHYF